MQLEPLATTLAAQVCPVVEILLTVDNRLGPHHAHLLQRPSHARWTPSPNIFPNDRADHDDENEHDDRRDEKRDDELRIERHECELNHRLRRLHRFRNGI